MADTHAGGDDDVQRAKDELTRQRRLTDQGLTMQARLRDRNRLVGTVLICTMLIASLVGVAFAFAGSGVRVTLLGITAARATWVGWLTVAIVAMTLVELVVDTRGAAQRRADAVRVLAALKAEYRVPPPVGEEVATARRMSERYAQAMETIPPIPEQSFNRLKAVHLRKVEVSKLLSKNPGMSLSRARRAVAKRHKHGPT
jgi:hypothetical protein